MHRKTAVARGAKLLACEKTQPVSPVSNTTTTPRLRTDGEESEKLPMRTSASGQERGLVHRQGQGQANVQKHRQV